MALPEITAKSLGSTSGRVHHLKRASYDIQGGPKKLGHRLNSAKPVLKFFHWKIPSFLAVCWPGGQSTIWAKKTGPQTHDLNSARPVLKCFHWKIPSFFSTCLYFCQIFTDFKFFTHRLSNKSFLIRLLTTPPYLKYVATLPCKKL